VEEPGVQRLLPLARHLRVPGRHHGRDPRNAADTFRHESDPDNGEHRTPGTMALTLILLGCFAVYYFANWKALADVWQVR
jgi:hypothetical protein